MILKSMSRPETPEKKKRMSLYLTPALKLELEELAKSKSRTISNMVEVLVLDAVKKAKEESKQDLV
jgi:hypothetical protein